MFTFKRLYSGFKTEMNNKKAGFCMKNKAILTLIMMICGTALAADPTESGVPTSPLAQYSAGAAIGVIRSINDSLKPESKNFFKLSFANDIYLTDVKHLFIDVDWLSPRANFGLDVGVDYLLPGTFRPFLGAGVGVRYFDKKGYKFGDNFGASATLHAGVLIELSKTVQLRIRAPFHGVLNQTHDIGAGLDMGLMFSKPYRHVKKLNYDQD
jgi:hypothetical protein